MIESFELAVIGAGPGGMEATISSCWVWCANGINR